MSELQLVSTLVLAAIGGAVVAAVAGDGGRMALTLRICGAVFMLPVLVMLWRFALLGG